MACLVTLSVSPIKDWLLGKDAKREFYSEFGIDTIHGHSKCPKKAAKFSPQLEIMERLGPWCNVVVRMNQGHSRGNTPCATERAQP